MALDNSQSAIAKRKLLEQELAEARKDLEETEYDHSHDSQIDALNKELEDYKEARDAETEALKNSLLEKETIIAQSFEIVKQNATLIGQEITAIANQHGIQVSDSIIQPWFAGQNAIGSYGATLTASTSAFIGSIIGVENQVWSLKNDADVTSMSLANMFATRADNLVQQLTDSYGAEWNLNAMTNALHDSLVGTIDGSYSGASAVSALDSIASAADNVASSAQNAANALRQMSDVDTDSITGKLADKKVLLVTGNSGVNFPASNRRNPIVSAYATGLTKAQKDELAWTQELGTEAIISPTRNAILTPIKQGDSVITAEGTKRLFDFANNGLTRDMFANSFVDPVKGVGSVTNVGGTNIHYDSLININGNVNDTNAFLGQITKVAENAIKQSWKDATHTMKYRK